MLLQCAYSNRRQKEPNMQITVRNDFAPQHRFSNELCEDTARENRAFFAELLDAPRAELPPLRHPAIDALQCPSCDAAVGVPCFASAESAHFERELACVRKGSAA
jgi:hypothetical protein